MLYVFQLYGQRIEILALEPAKGEKTSPSVEKASLDLNEREHKI
jgi:hypothetical protein